MDEGEGSNASLGSLFNMSPDLCVVYSDECNQSILLFASQLSELCS